VGELRSAALRATACDDDNDLVVRKPGRTRQSGHCPMRDPGAIPTIGATSARRAAPPYACAPLAPTQTATATDARDSRVVRAFSCPPVSRSPGLSSWITSASL